MMIAIVVLLVAVLSAVSSQVTSVNLLRTNKESNAAMADLQTAMEGILLDTIDEIPVNNPAGQPIAAFAGLNLPNERIVPTYPNVIVGGATPDPLEIVVDMTWSDWRGRPRSLRLATMKAR